MHFTQLRRFIIQAPKNRRKMEIPQPHRKNSTGNDGKSTSLDNQKHLNVTAEQDRQNEIHIMKVTEIENISPSVKKLILSTQVKPVPFYFKAGQWVDFFIPDVETVGGFSMISSPTYLKKTGSLGLAVQYSEHPPAHWVHTKCKIGSQVSIRIGGDFCLDTESITKNSLKNILLIAGGVGINPLFSMVNEIVDLSVLDKGRKSETGIKATLMFCAKTKTELLFHDSLKAIAKEEQGFKAKYFLTGQTENAVDGENETNGRITQRDIVQVLETDFHLQQHQFPTIEAYICGPSPMIKDIVKILKLLGVHRVFHEKWWITNP